MDAFTLYIYSLVLLVPAIGWYVSTHSEHDR
jgi:hypothetical protein